MAFFRQYIAPLFIFLIFLVALVAVSSRIFLPNDMMAPAPIGLTPTLQIALVDASSFEAADLSVPDPEVTVQSPVPTNQPEVTGEDDDRLADLPPSLSALVHGLSDDHLFAEQL